MDSLELTDGENLRFISGCHQWINTTENNRVDKLIDDHHRIDLLLNATRSTNDDDHSIELTTTEHVFRGKKFSNEEEDEQSLSHMDVSFDIHVQVNHGQVQPTTPSSVFSSDFEKRNLVPKNLSSCTSEMDMDNGENHTETSHEYSGKNKNDRHERPNRRQTNDANPNRNNNNSGR